MELYKKILSGVLGNPIRIDILKYIIAGVISICLIFSFKFLLDLMKKEVKDKEIKKISDIIASASYTFLKKQYLAIGIVAIIVSILLFFLFGKFSVLAFFLGVLLSSISGFYGMFVSVNSNSRTLEAIEKEGTAAAAKTAIFSAASVSFFLHPLALAGTISVYFFPGNFSANLLGISLGASIVSIFARLGGGIFTKGADVGADLVGKVEKSLPEDSPKNPAVIADNVGDNVGDCAGMSADLLESYVVSIASSILVLNSFFRNTNMAIFCFFIIALGIISSFLPLFLMKFKYIWEEFNRYFLTSFFLFVVSSFSLLSVGLGIDFIICITIGASVMVIILKLTEYFTSPQHQPVRSVAESASSGHGNVVIAGISISFISLILFVSVISCGILTCYYFAGFSGIVFGVLGTTALSPAILVLDIFGPISDNAGGICEMTNKDSSVRKMTDKLDQIGNTTKAITKGYTIGSAIFSAIIIFLCYRTELEVVRGLTIAPSLFDAFVLVGGLFGATLPFLFAGLACQSVSKAAFAIVEKVREQLRLNPKILEGTELPNYNEIVSFLTNFSIKEMVLPALIPIIGTISCYLTGRIFFKEFELLTACLYGIVINGSLLGMFMTLSGAIWDNSKKLIEEGYLGGKGTETHKAAVTGDTIGDPLKDTAGPSLNTFIKLSGIISTIIVASKL